MVRFRLAVGSFTRPNGGEPDAHGAGVSLLDFDTESMDLLAVALMDGVENAAYVAFDRGQLFSVSEGSGQDALVTAYSDDKAGGSTIIAGDIPCHIAFHPHGTLAAVCCYQSGSVRLHQVKDKGIGPEIAALLHDGASLHPTRQTRPHPHWSVFTADGDWLLVADRGTDHIWIYRIERENSVVRLHTKHSMQPGSGPRTLAFSPDGRFLLAILELANAVECLAWNAGTLEGIQTISTLHAAHNGLNDAAGLRFHPSQPWFALTNRGADTIVLFELSVDGAMRLLCGEATGAFPRDLDFSPDGAWLFTADQKGDSLSIFEVDAQAGTLRPAGRFTEIATPTCIRFAGSAG